MSHSVYWLQAGSCGGDTMSLLGMDSPAMPELLREHELELLWQPSLSTCDHREHEAILEQLYDGSRPLDVLCVEGAIIRGPGGTGMFDLQGGQPKKNIAARLAARARFVIAVGTCAAFGGIPVGADTEATGLQYHRTERGGFLGANWTSGAGLPVINLPGCPVHPAVLRSVLVTIALGDTLQLDAYNRPADWYSTLVHQGCTRNEYHEFRVEDQDFGSPGCMYFFLGCRGPSTYGPCNKHLWAKRNSRTRAGVPCVGCMRADFPQEHPFFRTRAIEGAPLDLPIGVDRAHFLAYKTMARAAAPDRLRERKTKV